MVEFQQAKAGLQALPSGTAPRTVRTQPRRGTASGSPLDASLSGEIIPYATSTRTRRNVAALRAAGWRLFVTPESQTTHGMPYAMDNGAWGAYQRGERWAEEPFLAMVDELGEGADFIVLPDIVVGGRRSLDRSAAWAPRLSLVAPILLPVQDGMTPDDVRGFARENIGLFVGGSTEWKLGTLPMWARFAKEHDLWLHVGRVNTMRRIRVCQMAGATSFDGTSATRYAVTLPKLDEQRRQGGLWRRRL